MPANPLFRLLVINGLAGALLGFLFVALVLYLDLAGIWSLLVKTGEWGVALAMLTIGSVTMFASVAMGGAIMMAPKEDGTHPPKGGLSELAPVAVVARARRSGVDPRHSPN
jgi:hypothetical protein